MQQLTKLTRELPGGVDYGIDNEKVWVDFQRGNTHIRIEQLLNGDAEEAINLITEKVKILLMLF